MLQAGRVPGRLSPPTFSGELRTRRLVRAVPSGCVAEPDHVAEAAVLVAGSDLHVEPDPKQSGETLSGSSVRRPVAVVSARAQGRLREAASPPRSTTRYMRPAGYSSGPVITFTPGSAARRLAKPGADPPSRRTRTIPGRSGAAFRPVRRPHPSALSLLVSVVRIRVAGADSSRVMSSAVSGARHSRSACRAALHSASRTYGLPALPLTRSR